MNKNSSISLEARHGILWVILPDSIDMDNYARIEQKILGEMELAQKDVALDFKNTKALFSSGIGLVMRIRNAAEAIKLRVSIINLNERIKENLDDVGLGSVLDIYPTEESFTDALRQKH